MITAQSAAITELLMPDHVHLARHRSESLATGSVPVDEYATHASIDNVSRDERPVEGPAAWLRLHSAPTDQSARLRMLRASATRSQGVNARESAQKHQAETQPGPMSKARICGRRGVNSADILGRRLLHFAARAKPTTLTSGKFLRTASQDEKLPALEHPIILLQGLADRLDGAASGDGRLDLNPRDTHGRTPLHYAALAGNTGSIAKLLDVAKLRRSGRRPTTLDLDPQDRGGVTPLALAAYSGNISTVQTLLKHYENLFAGPGRGKPPLVAKSRLSIGNALNETDFAGFTPLHYAAASGNAGVIEKLLSVRTNSIPADLYDFSLAAGNDAVASKVAIAMRKSVAHTSRAVRSASA